MLDQGHQPERVRRVDRLRYLVFALLLAAACKDDEPEKKGPGRFAAVKSEHSAAAADAFCEAHYPASGEGSRSFTAPPERPVPGRGLAAKEPGEGWTWVNLWASWCGPCLKEMPLLGRWGETLRKEGIPVRFEFWSIDESEDDLRGALSREIPGSVRWLRASGDLAPFLEELGVDKSSAIPVHALVDASGHLRCVRVGSVGEGAYGQVRALLAGG